MSKTSIEAAKDIRSAASRRTLSGPAMGARWSAVFFDAAGIDATALSAALDDAVEAVEAAMSSWRPDSDLERLNRTPLGTWVDLPAMLLEVLEASLEIGRRSGGAFDVGVGDLTRAWGFGGGVRDYDPAEVLRLDGRASFVPPKTLELDRANRRARRHAPLTVDLSGIAKGFGVDRMAAVMADFGIASYLVGIDGEMRAGAAKPDGRPWAVGQERPDRETRALIGVIDLVEAAVATSGDYRHFVEIDGRRRSHTFDPQTGAPLAGDLAQVTVIAETTMRADAWATALLVAGRERGAELARRERLSAIFVDHAGAVTSTLP
jgi:thiamine biosynthesis lipoprotein